MPGYASLHDFLEKEYLPAVPGVHCAPPTCPMGVNITASASAISPRWTCHPRRSTRLGLDQVVRIQAEMLAVSQKVGL